MRNSQGWWNGSSTATPESGRAQRPGADRIPIAHGSPGPSANRASVPGSRKDGDESQSLLAAAEICRRRGWMEWAGCFSEALDEATESVKR
jgi:hypothetical protein